VAAKRVRQRARAAARQKKEALYRELVLDAARRVFAEKGYDEARMGEIAERSGISLQTLYSVFPGKAGIYHAVHETGDRELHALVEETARDVADPLDALLTGLRVTTRYFLEHPDFLRMRLHGGFTWGSEASAAGHHGRTESWRAALEMLRAACQRSIDAGLLVARDPRLIARMMVAMQQVELAWWLEGGMQDDVDRVTGDVERQVVRAFCTEAGRARHADVPSPGEAAARATGAGRGGR